MALAALSGDEQGIIFSQLCNVLDTRIAVALSSINNELRTATQEGRQQLRADHEAAAALCLKVGLRSCMALREAKEVSWINEGLTAGELALLGTLGSVLSALETLVLVVLLSFSSNCLKTCTASRAVQKQRAADGDAGAAAAAEG